MPLLMEHRILTGRVADTEEKWMNPGDTKKSPAREGKNNRQNGLQILKKKRQQQRPACQENEGD